VYGIEVRAAETMEEALIELRRKQPDAAVALAPLIALYEEGRFSAHERSARDVIRRGLSKLTVNG
jgi:hypothetical protein